MSLAQPLLLAGAPLESAKAATIMIHGRGATASDILTYVPSLNHPGFAYLAPEVAGNSWYPRPFSAPLPENEPYLSSSLAVITNIVARVVAAGIQPERTILLGFSQGACLVLEYAARNPGRYGAIVGLSGALIGPDDLRRDDSGSLEETPVFLGCSDSDPYVPSYRVSAAAEFFRHLGGRVTERFYPNMGHTVNEDETDFVRKLMLKIAVP